MKEWIPIVFSCLAAIAAAAVPVHAGSIEDCLAGLERGQEHAPSVDQAHKNCGTYQPPSDASEDEQEELLQRECAKIHEVCEPIDAAAGARACLQAQGETSGDERREAASAYKYLKRIYDLCNVQ
jgi:hypothetical protein